MLSNHIAHLSVSSLQKFERCPYAWYKHYILEEKEPETEAMRFGKLVHLLIEEQVAGLDDGKKEEKRKLLSLLEGRENEAFTLADAGVRKIKDLKPQKIEIEKYFELSLPDVSVPLIGYIDAVLYTGDGKVILLDWKTGYTASPPDSPQLAVYGYALSDTELIPTEDIKAYYIYLAMGKEFPNAIDYWNGIGWAYETAKNLENKIVLMDNLLNTFTKKQGSNCIYCGYKAQCLGEDLIGYTLPEEIQSAEEAQDIAKYIIVLEEKLKQAETLLAKYCQDTGEVIETNGYQFGIFPGTVKRTWNKVEIFKYLFENQIPLEDYIEIFNIDLKGINKLAKKYNFTELLPSLVSEEPGKPGFKYKKA